MSNISFKSPPPVSKQPTPAESGPEVSHPSDTAAVSKAIAPVGSKAPAVVQSSIPVASGVVGEVSMSDIKLPRLNLVQKVGNLADQFTPGSIVFEKSIVLSDGKTPLDLTPLQIRKMYQLKQEWGEGDSGEAPEVYNTAAEVREAGGSLQWGDARFFAEIAHIQFAVKLPLESLSDELKEAAEVVDLFPYIYGDDAYALAMWTVASSAYTALAKPLFTASASLLRNGLYHGHYKVTSEIRKNAKNSWYAPRPSFAGKHTPEAAEFFKQIAGL